jgi:hypothetical protein
MKRAAAVAIVIVGALAIGISASGGSRSVRYGVAYVTGGASSTPQVWFKSSDGAEPRRLGAGQNPLLAPDGALVAVSANGSRGPALVMYSSSDGARHTFFNLREATALPQSWSSDSRYLAVVLYSTNPTSAAASGLAVIDTSTFSTRVVVRGPIYGASFARDGSDRIVYGAALSQALSARTNLNVIEPDGSRRAEITHDGRSLNPVWSAAAIAYDHEQLRPKGAPVYQVWLVNSDGSRPRALTHLPVPPLRNGLVPIGFSDDGTQLLAEYEGQNTNQAWVISTHNATVRRIQVNGQPAAAGVISRKGGDALVDVGGFLNPPDRGTVVSVSLATGRSRVLVAHGSQPSWNL